MTTRVCTCRRWELTGIPCKHVVVDIYNMSSNGKEVGIPEDWVSQCYWLNTWNEMYKYKIEGIVGPAFCSKCSIPSNLKPPNYHVSIGRTRKNRSVSKDEISEEALKKSFVKNWKLSKRGSTIKCATCGGKGQNKRACTCPRDNQKKGSGTRKEGVPDGY